MLDILQEHPGITIAELSKRFRMSGVGVLKHVKLLERAKLIVSRKEGRVRRLYFNAVPIQQIYDRWTDRYSSFWAARMADIKDRIENSLGLPEQSTDAAPAIGASPLTRSRQSA
jgi:predicted transcriptional regulator